MADSSSSPSLPSLPEPFARRVAETLGAEYPDFLAALAQSPPVSIRRNRRKPAPVFPDAEPVPWCPTGTYLAERPNFALDPLWHAGAYYVQEPSSLLLDAALRQYGSELTLRRVLDLCAAPGGKTTLLADFLDDEVLLVANEVIRSRVRILQENLIRWGSPNVVTTNHDPADFAPLAGFFDLVLVDAPCSGEGLFRKDPTATREWSEGNAEICAARQRRILDAALPLVRPGGILLYSTCTYNPAENDEAVAFALASGEWETLPLKTPPEWGITATEYGSACWPHRCRGEGFYLSILQRAEGKAAIGPPAPRPFTIAAAREQEAASRFLAEPEQYTLFTGGNGALSAVPRTIAEDAEIVRAALPRSGAGVVLGMIKGGDLVPDHELALSVACNSELPAVELSLADALRFLKKDTLDLADDTTPGWNRMRYQSVTLGWGKVLPSRFNNHLPMEWRLRQEIPRHLLIGTAPLKEQ